VNGLNEWFTNVIRNKKIRVNYDSFNLPLMLMIVQHRLLELTAKYQRLDATVAAVVCHRGS
jgi:hypothetical protein